MRNAVEIAALAFKGLSRDRPNLDALRKTYPELSFVFDELEERWEDREAYMRLCDENGSDFNR